MNVHFKTFIIAFPAAFWTYCPLLAQEDTNVIMINGSCNSSFYGTNLINCTNILSMHARHTSRTNFTVAVGDAVISFSGTRRMQHSNQKLDLIIDSVILDKVRLEAWGICNVAVSADASRYQSVKCLGKVGETDFSLQFAGAVGPNIESISASRPVSMPSNQPRKLSEFVGVWGDVSDKCRSYRAKTEGPYFTIREKSFSPNGGSGYCLRPTYKLQGQVLEIKAACQIEESPRESITDRYTMVSADELLGGDGTRYRRCAK